MKLFIDYVYQRRRGLLCLLLFILIFSVSFGLYHLPLAAVLYPTVLCILLGCCVVLADFLRIRKRHQFLERVRRREH